MCLAMGLLRIGAVSLRRPFASRQAALAAVRAIHCRAQRDSGKARRAVPAGPSLPSMQRRTFLHTLAALAAASGFSRRVHARQAVPPGSAAAGDLSLWYSRAARQWVEALPIGNGRLGGMVYGGVGVDRLALNDDTLWSGGPGEWNNPGARDALVEVRRLVAAGRVVEADAAAKRMMGPYTQSYMPAGEVRVTSDHGDVSAGYRRALDLATGTATVTYRQG